MAVYRLMQIHLNLDRIIILRLNTDEMQIEILLDEHIEKAKESIFSGLADGKYYIFN
jgi:uncharacterized protein YheU (UPF0270 family)